MAPGPVAGALTPGSPAQVAPGVPGTFASGVTPVPTPRAANNSVVVTGGTPAPNSLPMAPPPVITPNTVIVTGGITNGFSASTPATGALTNGSVFRP